MSSIDEAKALIETYRQQYGFTSPLQCGEYALTPENWRSNYIPYCDKQGVYLFFGSSGSLLYVGKASMGHDLGREICRHFSSRPQLESISALWSEKPSNLLVVAVENAYEAPSLEEYLILKLNPRDNTLGRL